MTSSPTAPGSPAPGTPVTSEARTTPGTHNCAPTLTDTQVLDFCKKGFMVLEGVVPDEINRQTLAFMQDVSAPEPTELLRQKWFVDNVILNPAAAGAVRSLLGPEFHTPILMSSHRGACPYSYPLGWHIDGNYKFGPDLPDLQVFYYPQETTLEMGPTELLPGSHFWWNQQRFMSHLGRIRGSHLSASPAGTIFITVYHIWHRRAVATAPPTTIRHLLKYCYWRTTPPKRNWIIEPGFDLAHVDYDARGFQAYSEQFKNAIDAAEMFYWLCGQSERFHVVGGQSWPLPAPRMGTPYGFPGPGRAGPPAVEP